NGRHTVHLGARAGPGAGDADRPRRGMLLRRGASVGRSRSRRPHCLPLLHAGGGPEPGRESQRLAPQHRGCCERGAERAGEDAASRARVGPADGIFRRPADLGVAGLVAGTGRARRERPYGRSGPPHPLRGNASCHSTLTLTFGLWRPPWAAPPTNSHFSCTDMATISAEIVTQHQLSPEEYDPLVRLLGRDPPFTPPGTFSVMWSEHCSYKSSRVHLKKLPTQGPRILQGPGENAGVVDIGSGFAVAFKIESHNHPSFIEPFQGAATGVGGILRDIFTMGA